MRFARTVRFICALVVSSTLLSGCQRIKEDTPVDPLAAYPWLYLRDNQPVVASENLVSLIAVGDIQLGRNVPDPSKAFENVEGWLSTADITLGNLEGTLAPIDHADNNSEQSPISPILLSADPLASKWLSQAGFDVLSLANNHSQDAGAQGLALTVQLLEEAGLKVIGTQQHEGTTDVKPLIIEKGGLRLAFLAVNAIPIPTSADKTVGGNEPAPASEIGISQWDKDTISPIIQSARAQADIVIVSIHWGYEYQKNVDPAQEWIADAILQSGADIIIGHHPHVTQPFDIRTNSSSADSGASTQVIAYSLGNFVFDQEQGETGLGQALRIFFDRQGLRAIQSFPIQAGPKPRLLSPDTEYSGGYEDNGVSTYTCDELDCTALSLPDDFLEELNRTPSGIYTSGATDLTGDGQKEDVELVNGRITIFQDDQIEWQSPAEWQVVDLALGDPDQDGRQDLLAAFWKPDSNGIRRSHPFLIRQQGGRYQEVWGGSAVSDPILEIEIGDLDGDGLDELVVLEQNTQSHLQAVTVWRWHGWGFSLDWRSPEGNYEDLSVREYAGKMIFTIWKGSISN